MSETRSVLHEATNYESIGKDLAAVADKNGRLWCAWHAMPAEGKDDILVRWWDGCNTSAHQRVSAESGVNCNPVLVCGPDSTWVFWTAKRQRWCVLASRFQNEGWHEETQVAESTHDGTHTLAPTAAADPTGRVWLAYLRDDGKRTTVCARVYDGQWQADVRVSNEGFNYRPRIAAGPDGRCWLVWDRFTNHTHVIMSAQWDGARWLPEEQVSRSADRELIPDITVDAFGRPWVAWIRLQDVCDEGGVVDQKTSILCADRQGGTWRTHEDVALLYQGLLARQGAWGYFGRRRRPMICADIQGGVHLFYEIKETEDESTGQAAGFLLMRHWDGKAWSDVYELCREDYGYVVARPGELPKNHIIIVARRGWEEGSAQIVARDIGIFHLKRAKLDDPAEWAHWKPCTLPLTRSDTPRPGVTVRNQKYRLFWGDLHCHGYFSSDAEGELDELLFYARDRAQLDFCAVTDNDNYVNRPLTDSEWQLTQHETSRATEPGKFAAFSAYEWTCAPNRQTNHRIVVYNDCGQPVFRHTDPQVRDINGLVRCLEGREAFMFAHHLNWVLTRSQQERNVEVCSSWRVCIDKATAIRECLDAGRRFGFLGCSDTHRRVPGLGGALTGVFAEELSREAIFDALKARRCYATTGSRIFIDFSIDGRFMGEGYETREIPHVHIHIAGAAPIASVEVIRNGRVVKKIDGRGERFMMSYEDFDIPEGTNYYYLRVAQEGKPKDYPTNLAPARGNLAWSSPIWVRKI
ncbi:MAG: CehA/McbA family metallohydrolase [Planctomycetes bacterium]|nr:CehA/McbA family metallohydrolase [Planctomycetota bacterium]